jgi:gamma-glutamyltranspeptidase / glutathione hydrolase
MAKPGSGFSWSRQEVGRTAVSARECLVVAARRETVEAGLRVLDEGGNAVDAAVCMAFVAAVAEPSEASIGGSGFMLVHDAPRGSSWSVEFPPRAPLRARPDLYEPPGETSATGPLAPCVPGAVAGLCLAGERFGSLPLGRLMAPAIELADAGVGVDEYLTLQALAHIDALRASPNAARIFLSDGLPPVGSLAGDSDAPRMRQPDLARTLRAIAEGGPNAFYRGDIAAAVERAFEDRGGLISRADLDAYRATVESPLRRSYRGWSVLAPRAPCGGWTVLRALGALERLDLGELGRATVEGLHAVAEALHAAFAERDRAGDDTGHGTTHLNVIDADGRIVSCTLTAGRTFGSKFVAAGTGVLFDSGMSWFDPRPGSPNSIAPGKRPLVNMAPLLLMSRDGRRVAVGAAGGRRIISAVTQVVCGIVDHGLALQDAVSAPRIDASDSVVRLSDRLPDGTADGLRALGHEVTTVAEQHVPFSYELARPSAAGIDELGLRSGGIHPFASGFVAGR